MRNARNDLLAQATHFYSEVPTHDGVMAMLLRDFNTTPAIYAARQAEMGTVFKAIQVQQHEIGRMREATKRRHEAIHALDDWMAQFSAIARTAFRHNPEQLRKLGILVKGDRQRLG